MRTLQKLWMACGLGVMVACAAAARAATININWAGAGNGIYWNDPDNWSPPVVPNNNGDDYLVQIPGWAAVRIRYGSYTINELDIDGGGSVTIESQRWLRLNQNSGIDGQIRLNAYNTASLFIDGNATLDGVGSTVFVSSGPNYLKYTNPTDVLTVGVDHTVTSGPGALGTIQVDTVNNGAINAAGAGSRITLKEHSVTNNNLLTASGGGTLEIYNAPVTNAGAGQIVVDSGSTLKMSSGQIIGGSVTLQAGATALLGGTSVVKDGFFDGGSLQLEGVAQLPTQYNALFDNMTLSNSSAVIRGDQTLRLKATNPQNVDFALDSGITGYHRARLQIDGNVTFQGAGRVRSAGYGSELTSVNPDELLTIASDYRIEVPAGSPMEVWLDLLNHGLISVDDEMSFPPSWADLTNDADGRIEGTGTIRLFNQMLINSGTLAPGHSAGKLLIRYGNYQQTASGVLEIEIGGLTPGTDYDWLEIQNGSAYLDGILDIELIGSFVPTQGDTFTVLTAAGGITDNGLQLAPEDVATWALVVGSNTMAVQYAAPPPCVCGDPDGNGVVNLNDFIVFARCFGMTSPSGGCTTEDWFCSDLDGSGEVNLNDFVTFARLFGQPASGSPPNCP